jgi:hypothetical protein
MTETTVNNLTMDLRKTVNDTQLREVQYSKIDLENGRLTSYDCFSIQKGLDKPRVLKGKFTLQIYTAKELREILTRNGFEILNHYAIDGSEFLEHTTTNILTVAKREHGK